MVPTKASINFTKEVKKVSMFASIVVESIQVF